MAPEAIHGKLNLKSDIWACGVLLFFLLIGHHPFRGKGEMELRSSILRGLPDFG
jgi:serine/threonine protein kinase